MGVAGGTERRRGCRGVPGRRGGAGAGTPGGRGAELIKARGRAEGGGSCRAASCRARLPRATESRALRSAAGQG